MVGDANYVTLQRPLVDQAYVLRAETMLAGVLRAAKYPLEPEQPPAEHSWSRQG